MGESLEFYRERRACVDKKEREYFKRVLSGERGFLGFCEGFGFLTIFIGFFYITFFLFLWFVGGNWIMFCFVGG